MAAKVVEQETGLAAAAVGAASAAASAAQSVTTEVAAAAQEAAQAAQSVTTEVAAAAQEATRDAASSPRCIVGIRANARIQWDAHVRSTAAIRQVQAEMSGGQFNYMGHTSYEAAMAAFAEAEAAGKTQIDLTNEFDYEKNPEGMDPNRMGPVSPHANNSTIIV